MPLHLLGKKSWNVYNTANVEKVKRDEAAAAALEAAEEERMQEADAHRRMQILRGETPTPLAIEEAPRRPKTHQDGSVARESGHGYGRDRKRRKKAGENDTDFEMRIAVQERDEEREVDRQLVLRKPIEAPLVDQRGNISLFPETTPSSSKVAEKNPEAEREAARNKKEQEDQYTMRFSNAAGLKRSLDKPWYSLTSDERMAMREEEEKALSKAERRGRRKETRGTHVLDQNFDIKGKQDYGGEITQRDVWGNEDSMRKERTLKRMMDIDPLAMMKTGARQVRNVEKERKSLRDERARDIRELGDIERKKRRRRRDELEWFRLDEPLREEELERNRKRKRRLEDEGFEDGKLDDFELEKRSSSSRHEGPDGEIVGERDREGRHGHKESRRSSHREEGRERHRRRSRYHEND